MAQVVEKLLSAHRHRTLRMTKQYQQQLAHIAPDGDDAAPDSSGSGAGAGAGAGAAGADGGAGTVTYARRFHQSLMVGLIEACKGIAELFSDILAEPYRCVRALFPPPRTLIR